MKFTKQFLLDTIDDASVLVNEIVGKRRWSIDYRMVFEHDGCFFESRYSVGATESQCQSPYDDYDYDTDEIECVEVFAKTKTVTVYEVAT